LPCLQVKKEKKWENLVNNVFNTRIKIIVKLSKIYYIELMLYIYYIFSHTQSRRENWNKI
jgi:hypothetical protein